MQPPSPLQLASCRVPAPIRADVCDGHWHEYARRQCTGLVLLVQIDKTTSRQRNIKSSAFKCKSLDKGRVLSNYMSGQDYLWAVLVLYHQETSILSNHHAIQAPALAPHAAGPNVCWDLLQPYDDSLYSPVSLADPISLDLGARCRKTCRQCFVSMSRARH